MTENLEHTLADALAYLQTLSREGTRPEEARARCRLLQELHPGMRVDLLWEEEAYDRSVHYDLLLHRAGVGTVSLSFCPERSLPWPLRGVHPWGEDYLVRVNGVVVRVDQAMACLDFIWDEAPILDRLVNMALIEEALAADPIPLSDAELQRSLDAFRRTHKLYTAADTARWLEQKGMTHDKLERLLAGAVTAAKLRDRVAAGRVEEYFERHQSAFDTAHVARLVFADEPSARRVAEHVRGGGASFYEAAQRCFLASKGPEQPSRDLFAVLRRGRTDPGVAAVVFAAQPGDVLGPVRDGDDYCLFHLLSLAPARLDEPTRNAVKEGLFEGWLAERRRAAAVEWFWGDATRKVVPV
jgi:putative peptide maturation system protein